METSAIMENRTWRLPQGPRRAPAWWRCPPMRFLGRVQVLTGAVMIWALLFAAAGWGWWALALFGCFLYGCVGLSVGLHRYFAHRSFEAPHWAVVMCRMPGVMTCIGAVNADTKPVALTTTTLSPDGQLVALGARVRGDAGTKLMVSAIAENGAWYLPQRLQHRPGRQRLATNAVFRLGTG